ncbi:MAG: hypothetical protein KA764_13800 [Anaerolineales bacterium]|nr:hypothetical protein [Anaerolineales bacterium]
MTMNCPNCQAPETILYGPGDKPAGLTGLQLGNWISLEQCGHCRALWCASLYEPYAAFEYLVRWDYDAATWRRVHDADAGRALLRWHAAMIRENWQQLSAPARERVDQHRRRSQGHNPIDNPAAFGAARSSEISAGW